MARRKKKSGGGAAADGWLVTFSDLMTLLLTFFVLLLSMASMDTTVISRISAHFSSLSLDEVAAGRIPDRIIEVVAMLRDPDSAVEKQERLKDLLFPHDVLPPELLVEIKDNLSILEHPEGVVIVLTEGLLFAPGSFTLDDTGKKLLEMLSPVILAADTDVNISGHTDQSEGYGPQSYELAGRRATAVLNEFLLAKIRPQRFSVSSYGPDKPIGTLPAKNRRVEILLKTTRWIGKYADNASIIRKYHG